MSIVKDLQVKVISRTDADNVIRKIHYSGNVSRTTQLCFGIFRNDILIGALQFGGSIDKRRMAMSLGIKMNESIELNRLAIHDIAGKNSESRVLGICLRMIKKQYPFIKCVVSFADATQCGDGTIYRASNFKLFSYKKNNSLFRISNEMRDYLRKFMNVPGDVIANKSLANKCLVKKAPRGIKKKVLENAIPLQGYQLKYIYYFDKELESKHKHIPFDKIPENIKMYKGIKRIEHEDNAVTSQVTESGSTPTGALHNTVLQSNQQHNQG